MLLVAAIVYSVDFAARHLGAMVFISGKTGALDPQYSYAVNVGGQLLLPVAAIALLLGIAYLAWAEIRPEDRQ